MMYRRLRKHLNVVRLPVATGLLTALILAGCASAPPAPTAKLQAAQQAIASAERTEAGRYAAGELGAARTKLASADTAVSEKRMILAAQFADESRAEAELASAKAAVSKANAVNEDMKRSTGTLVEEMKRSNGDKP
jgi:PBP1b-binding outer membrane lipoprotein LpoB